MSKLNSILLQLYKIKTIGLGKLIIPILVVGAFVRILYISWITEFHPDEYFTIEVVRGYIKIFPDVFRKETNPIFFFLYSKLFPVNYESEFLTRLPYTIWNLIGSIYFWRIFKHKTKSLYPYILFCCIQFSYFMSLYTTIVRSYSLSWNIIWIVIFYWYNKRYSIKSSLCLGIFACLHFTNIIPVLVVLMFDLFDLKKIRLFLNKRYLTIILIIANIPQLLNVIDDPLERIVHISTLSFFKSYEYISYFLHLYPSSKIIYIVILLMMVLGCIVSGVGRKGRQLLLFIVVYTTFISALTVAGFRLANPPVMIYYVLFLLHGISYFSEIAQHKKIIFALYFPVVAYLIFNGLMFSNEKHIPDYFRFRASTQVASILQKKYNLPLWTSCTGGVSLNQAHYWSKNHVTNEAPLESYCLGNASDNRVGVITHFKLMDTQNEQFKQMVKSYILFLLKKHKVIDCEFEYAEHWVFSKEVNDVENIRCNNLLLEGVNLIGPLLI